MACYHPVQAWRLAAGGITFIERGDIVGRLDLPCGRCIGCRLERSRQWAVRINHEASLWPSNCFLTLTYDDDHLPNPPSLNYEHVQLFLKRLRKTGRKVRFFAVGEYGEESRRPHYHLIVFNCFFPDRIAHKRTRQGNILWRSDELTKLWGKGHCLIGDVTFESAAYCARYCVDKVTGDLAESHYRYVDDDGVVTQLEPEMAHMSLKPGIGKAWLDKYASDVYPSDEVIVRGRACKPPRYYDKKALKDSVHEDDVIFARTLDARSRFDDNTDQRLRVREQVATARLKVGKKEL